MCLTHMSCIRMHVYPLDFLFRCVAVKPSLVQYALVRFENLLSVKHVMFIVLSCVLEMFEVLNL